MNQRTKNHSNAALSTNSAPSSTNNLEEGVEAELREIMSRFNITGPLEKFDRTPKMSQSGGSGSLNFGQSQSLTQLHPIHQGINHMPTEN